MIWGGVFCATPSYVRGLFLTAPRDHFLHGWGIIWGTEEHTRLQGKCLTYCISLGSRLERDVLKKVVDNETDCGFFCMYLRQK